MARGARLRLVTFSDRRDGAPRPGVEVAGGIAAMPAAGMAAIVAAGLDAAEAALEQVDSAVPVEQVRLHAPLTAPGKVIGIGLNYRDHAEETGKAIPSEPIVFAKWASAVIGPGEPIRVDAEVTTKVDYEAELGVVIGRPARRVTAEDALEHVFGYVNVNDVSARDLQAAEGGQWTRAKSLDTFAPMGPCIVTRDEVADPQTLGIRCLLGGEVMQDSTTAEMIFGVAELISFLSRGMTLLPGDVIATGTPPGVGAARTPRRWLVPGDEVTVEVEGLGRLTNPVEAA